MLAILWSIALAVLAVAQASPVIVGIIDHTACDGDSGRALRPMFVHSGNAWLPVAPDTHTSTRQWSIAFDGRDLGTVATVGPEVSDRRNGDDWSRNRLILDSGAAVPHITIPPSAFGTECGNSAARPLVVVSRPNYRDPEAWKPFRPDTAFRHLLFGRFKAGIDSAIVCPGGGERMVRWRFRPADLKLVKGYHNNRGQQLVAVQLDPGRNHCDGPPGPEYSVHWYRVDQDTALVGRDLELVDAGDYDADGQSEVLFAHNAMDEDGYTLVYANLRERVDFWWHYH